MKFDNIQPGHIDTYIDSDNSELIKKCTSKSDIIITFQYYNSVGDLHRLDGPAIESFYVKTNTIRVTSWYKNNKKHKVDGPSYIFVSDRGEYIKNYYYNNIKYNNLSELQQTVLKDNINEFVRSNS